MHSLLCPHCKSHRIVTSNVPRDVVVVMPCPACGELTVLFRNRAIAVDKHVLEKGSRDERIAHCSNVIAELLDSGMFFADEGPPTPDSAKPAESQEMEQETVRESPAPRPPRVRRRRAISQDEVEHFVSVELSQLDDATTFRKLFG